MDDEKISMLERRSGIALWRQIADSIRIAASSGLADDEGKLPSEAELADRYGVNRHTVRAAIASLVSEGVLRAEQGRGTFVEAPARYAYPIGRRTRFSQGLSGQTSSRRTTVLSHREEPADPQVAGHLDLAVGTPVIRVDHVGEADKVRLSRATSWFDAGRFEGIGEQIAASGSVTRALEHYGVDDYVRLKTVIRAVHAGSEDLADLQLSPGAIVIEASATNADVDGRVIQYARTRFAADRIELTIEAESANPIPDEA